ncbi:hypothetical protein ACFX19_002258 [Malus domestica]
MARTLSEIELTDHNKLSIVKDGALGQLLELLSEGDIEKRKVGVKALLHLSNLPQNGLQMIREGSSRGDWRSKQDNDGVVLHFLGARSQRCVETFLRIVKSSNDVEEIAAAMGIIANLPKDAQMARWLLDAEAVEIICNCLTDGN